MTPNLATPYSALAAAAPRRAVLRHLGPGILLAATSVGASHILLAPEAGARYELQLVWLVLAVHVLKYPAFEMAPRYVAGRDESLLEAYAAAPGPRHWAVWLGLGDMTVQAVGLVAALVGLTAAFVVEAAGVAGIAGATRPGATPLAAALLAAGLLALLRWGRYRALRAVNLFLLLALAAGTLLAFLGAPPTGVRPTALLPGLPAGSLLLVAAILGFMPTSIGVSIWQSLWALEQRRTSSAAYPTGLAGHDAERIARLRSSLLDLRLGYGLSAVLAAIFVCLGATLLHPRGLVPQGREVALVLSELYALSLGEWMRPVFLGTAFAALATTCYTMMDGFPRSFVAACRVLRGEAAVPEDAADADQGRVYWSFLLAVTFGGMALLAVLPDPASWVKWVGAIGLLVSPVYYVLNLWAVRRRVTDPRIRPGRLLVILAFAGVVFLAATAVLFLWTLLAPAAA